MKPAGRACLPLLAAALLLAAPGPAAAERIMLEDVVRAVLEGNLNVEKEQQNITRAQAQLRQAKGKFDWKLFADTSVARKEVPDEVGGLLSAETHTDIIYGASAGISKTFRNGILVSPKASIYRNNSSESSSVLSEQVTGASIELLIPLLRGAGVSNAAVEELAQTEVLKASELSATFATQKLMQLAVRAYWRTLALKYSLDIQLAMEREIAGINTSVRQLIERGELPPLAGQELAADHALRQMEINQTRELLFLSRRELADAMGIRVSGPDDLPLAVGEFPRLVNLPQGAAGESGLIETAVANRSDLKSMERLLQSEDIRLSEAKNSTKPRIDIVLDHDTLALRYAQSLNANIERGRVSERAVAVHVAELNMQLLHQAISADVQRALGRMQLSSDNYRLAVETFWLLNAIADDKARQVRLGATNRSDQIATLDKRALAHRQVIDASLQYASGITDLRLITGTIAVDGSRSAAELANDFRVLPGLP